MLVLAAALGGYLYTVREQGIFACSGAGYGGDRILAYCQASQYGDYDHGAFWFSLEPGIREAVARAQVLFLGNSRVQFGFSGGQTRRYMDALPARYFLMGFAYWENYTFPRALLRQIRPHPQVVIINMDDYFETRETDVARSLMQNDSLKLHYRVKRLWQWPHRALCGMFASLCGGNEAFFRSLSTGEYLRVAAQWGHFVAAYDDGVDAAVVSRYTPLAREFIDSLGVPDDCVIMTIVPSTHTRLGTARSLAAALGITLVAPRTSGLTTFDHSHLDPPSAQRWSAEFLEAAGPRIRQCLAGHGAG